MVGLSDGSIGNNGMIASGDFILFGEILYPNGLWYLVVVEKGSELWLLAATLSDP